MKPPSDMHCRSYVKKNRYGKHIDYDLFVDHTYAEASLARVLSESYRLEMNGKNMRNLEPLNKRKNG